MRGKKKEGDDLEIVTNRISDSNHIVWKSFISPFVKKNSNLNNQYISTPILPIRYKAIFSDVYNNCFIQSSSWKFAIVDYIDKLYILCL